MGCAAGGANSLEAKIGGTIQTQTVLSPSDGRFHTEPLNNARVFEEFLVSPDDYELPARSV